MFQGYPIGGEFHESTPQEKEAVPETLQDSQENIEQKVRQIDNFTENELYGYDAYDTNNKKMVFDEYRKETIKMSRAVSMLASAQEKEIEPICVALLRKFKIKMDVHSKATFFSGATENDRTSPAEMRYAFLRLLGIGQQSARRNFQCDGIKNLDLSENFQRIVAQTQEKRRLFPLEHSEKFSDVDNALSKIREHAPGVDVKNIFKKDSVPPLHPSQINGEQSEFSLVAALSILAMALEKGVPITIAYANDTSPFSDTVLTLVEKKRDEKKAQQVQPESKLG